MMITARHSLRKALLPLTYAILIGSLLIVQFFVTPPALGNFRLLSAAATSSPRSALEGFRANVADATSLLKQAYNQHLTEPGFLPSDAVDAKVKEAEILLSRAARYLDLREVAPVELAHRRLEATLLLKEILDRLPLPDPSSIPGDAEVAEAPRSWNVPGTDIRIVPVTDGDRAGEYVFSGETVRQLDDFYQLVRDQPRLESPPEDFYAFFSQSPGYLLPPKWYSLIEALPASYRTEFYGQAVWQWIALVVVLALAFAVVMGVRRITAGEEADPDTAHPLLASAATPMAVAVSALIVVYLTDYQINLTGAVNDVVEEIGEAIAYLAAIWGVLKLSNTLAGRLTFSKSESIDAHLARAAVRISGIGIALALLIYAASYLGIPLAGLLAGLGVGGLAVALAAKPTLENFIGGLILYADRPVRVGDLCRFGSLEGRVQEIGIRSTRIRGLDRALITIPNATFVNMNIINLTNRDRMPYNRVVGLTSKESDVIRQEIEGLSTLIANHPKIEKGSLEVRLREGHEEKPKAEIRALILTSKWDEFLDIQQDIDLMLRNKVLEFAKAEDAPADRDNLLLLAESR